MKRLLRNVWAIALLSTLVLTGCTVTPDMFSGSRDDRSLTVWTYLAGEQERANFDELEALFAAQHPGIDVRYVAIPLNQFAPKLLAAASTGEGPDVIIGNPVVDFPLLSRAGVYADLTPWWREYSMAAGFPNQSLWREQHKLYAVHWRFNDLGLWYNKDILDEYGLKVPKTVPEFERAMRVIERGGKYTPVAFAGDPTVQTAWAFTTWLYSAGVTYCDLASPRTEHVLGMLSRWVHQGYLANDTAALDTEEAFDRLLTGNYAFAVAGSWEVGTVKEKKPDFEYGSTPLPAGSAGNKMSFAGESIGIGRYAADKDLAWEYLRTASLSKRAQLTTFENTGALPSRLDVRRDPAVSGAEIARPFVSALEPRRLVPWPDNPNTLDAQTAVGTTFSSMIAGDLTPAEAAEQMRSRVTKAFEDGGGDC